MILDGTASGVLLETFVFTQLAALIDAAFEDYQLFHYRDKLGREIDFIVENEDGHIAGIEVKASTSISKDSFKHLRWFKENLAKDKSFIGIILYTGAYPLSFGGNFCGLQINALWLL